MNGQTPATVLGPISAAATMEEALAEATHVQENTPEVLETKIKVFRGSMQRRAPMPCCRVQRRPYCHRASPRQLKGRGRCIVVHPINPPYLIPAAEVVPAPWTTAETVERTRRFLVAAGHAPLVMKRNSTASS